ncbi:MAG: heme ABC exporter ATP-binding protein CcmA [Pseudomonadota bacterium]
MTTTHPQTFAGSDLAMVYDTRPVFRKQNFALQQGEMLHVKGANGSGKSSLLRNLAGLLPLSHGSIALDGQSVNSNTPEYRQMLSYLGHANPLDDHISIARNLAFFAKIFHQPQALVDQWVSQLGLQHCKDQMPPSCSHGQKRRSGLIVMFLKQAPIWILDEPLNGLDDNSLAILTSAFQDHLKKSGMIVMSSHSPIPYANHTLVMDKPS